MLSSFSLSDSTIGFIIDGPYDENAIEKIQAEVNEKLETFEKLNLYMEDTVEADISLRAILKKLPFQLVAGNRFNKVAVVTDRKLLQIITMLRKIFFNAELRHFATRDRIDAIQWISQ